MNTDMVELGKDFVLSYPKQSDMYVDRIYQHLKDGSLSPAVVGSVLNDMVYDISRDMCVRFATYAEAYFEDTDKAYYPTFDEIKSGIDHFLSELIEGTAKGQCAQTSQRSDAYYNIIMYHYDKYGVEGALGMIKFTVERIYPIIDDIFRQIGMDSTISKVFNEALVWSVDMMTVSHDISKRIGHYTILM